MSRGWLLTLSALLALAAASTGLFLYLRPSPLPAGLLYGNGRIEGTEVRVGAELQGRIVESRLVEGQTVQRGDLLVRIDDADLQIRLAQAAAELSALDREHVRVEEELRTAQHHLQTADIDFRRYRELQERGTATPQRLEQAENTFQDARGRAALLQAQVAEVEAHQEAMRQSIRFVRSQIEKTEIHAPLAATILLKGVEPGEVVQPGRTVAVLVDLSSLELRVFIPEGDLARIRLGEAARVRTDAFPDRYWVATVIRVDQRAQFTPRDIHMPAERVTMVFGVVLSVANPTGELKPGMPADAWIRTQPEATFPDRLVVPR
jgi:HlyD family secretion protein